MKVVTLNLAGYKNWNEREAKLVTFLDETQSDVVFLQEVKYDPLFSPLSQSRYLNTKLARLYRYSQTSVSRFYQPPEGDSYREGLAVLSNYPIVDSEVLVLTKRPDDTHTRIIQKVSILVDEQVVNFTNVHFSNNQYSIEQLNETLTISKNRNDSSIILGDFNIHDVQTVSDLYAPDYTASTEFTKYISFPSEAATFDYVLLPKSYNYMSLSVGKGLSDHNALVIELDVNKS